MLTTWVLVADASCAQLYRQSPSGELEMFMEFDHPQSRMKGNRLASDRPGRQQSKGMGHGTFAGAETLKQHEAETFARELAETIEKGRAGNSIKELIIAAPPHFSGLLNRSLSKHSHDLVRASVEKDYTKLAPRDLQARLALQIKPKAS